MNDQERNDEQRRRANNSRAKRKKDNRLLYVVLVLLVLILIGFAWYVFNTHPKPENPTTQDSTTTVTEETTTETTDNANGTTTEDTNTEAVTDNYDPGETYTIGSETDINGLKQTLNSASVNQTLGSTTAPEGQTYLKVDWTINNTTNGELGFNPNNYVAYANGVQVPSIRVDDPSITPLTAGTIQAGGTVTGSVVYQVPDTWSEVQIYSHINPTVNQEVEYRISSDQL